MAEKMRENISAMLKGIDRYNPNNLACLENYVKAQVKENVYDLEANLAVLKLYQFNPNFFQEQIAVYILIKALTNMPNTDFILCKCLIDPSYLETEIIKKITDIHQLLETCQFREFWNEVAKTPELFNDINGFHDSIRKYISYVVNITYQRIERSFLKEILGNLGEAELNRWMSLNGWREDDYDFVFIANQEENIKTKNITEKIDFESVAPVLATYR
ncbi:eukaryotic translation initiation factor 3 subunit K-like protein [Dinothrombium tinctorium]|uniref:Eukaryotic translation initiation factor 3 subunit K n=1 Tax=Dinothrombium tinctorium TaxID=1965070 RepID=A0A3S3QL10_9ACAR|nr:eukaryotic translation initiation factor 3 subunit K-like protein [Dinothrombium tinctorium]RWS10395.1 eukaryotic translation initiation factor 3 subunit K-like protein [Dinothrombium tinctorium]